MKHQLSLSCLMLSTLACSTALAEVSVNGFASITAGIADSDAGYLGYTQDFDFQPDSVAAVQLGYAINDKMTATVQILARGRENWEPGMEWAYLSYNAENGNTYRAGRLRVPYYLYSDYLDVRYAQPFLRPPKAIYGLTDGFTSYTGIDAIVPVDLGNSTLTFQPYYGSHEDSAQQGAHFKLSNLMGTNVTWDWEDLSIRGIYHQMDIKSDNVPLIDGVDNSYVGLGVKYDPGHWFGVAEYGAGEMSGAFPDTKAMYVSMGYRLGDWTPYMTVGMIETTDNEKRASIPSLTPFTYERTEYSLGTRWDYLPNVALKADLSWYGDFGGTSGFSVGAYDGMQSDVGEDVSVLSLSIDTVF